MKQKLYYQKQNIIVKKFNALSMQPQLSTYNKQEVINQLMRMLDHICQNAGYLRYFQNEYALIDTKIYFDICQIIFSELSIRLIKIQQYEGLNEGEKLDCLINFLINQLGLDLPGLSGKQIIRFNISHIYQFLNLLLQYSKLYFERGSGALQPSVKTQPHEISEQIDNLDRNPFSARPPGGIAQYSHRSNRSFDKNHVRDDNFKNGTNEKNGAFQKTKAGKRQSSSESPPQYIQQAKKKSQKLYDALVKVVIEQKNRVNKSSLRDQRKNKNQDLIQTRNKYKQYLKSYSKQKRAQSCRKRIQSKKQQLRQSHEKLHQLPLKDFQNMDNFFKSFNYKLRDLKQVYLQRMQKQIRQKQRSNAIHRQRIQRQKKQQLEKLMQKQVQCLNNQHHIRKQKIREASIVLEHQIKLVQKEMKTKANRRKSQLKHNQRKDLQNIENLIRQQNQRVFMELEEGGRLQKLIMSAYNKF